ncbi:MAG: 23S rRNA (uracil(1939)-C(5))-methyltransferase RlmD [Deltaproteobacteria bacterium]|nr:23S rRNA (uracil(1939)-C(5))-methyltransferase RlmD [Deltaproteobacteria bacterium]
MTVKKGQELELHVERMAHGRFGVARTDGFVVFVRDAAPGDRVRARVFRKKKGYAEAGLIELLEPSPDRVEPPCPYSGVCGGCQWQHVAYPKQLDYKRDHVRDAVERIGGLENVPVHETIPSERVFGYRNKMEFSFSDRRWLLPGEMGREDVERGLALGLHVPGTFNKIIDVEACLIQAPLGNELLGAVRERVRQSGLPVYGIKSHQGFWRFLTLRHSVARDEWLVNLVTAEDRPGALEPVARDLRERFPGVRTVVHNVNTRRAAIAVGEREHVLAGDGILEDRLGPYTFRISANSFFQTNTRGAESLYETVTAYAALDGTETVLDLYSGTGTIPILLSDRAERVIGMEVAESAVADAERNCAGNGIQNCRFIAGDVRETLAGLDAQADVLIIDPPRAGMHRDVLAEVLNRRCGRVVYVSCNPATLARDLAGMSSMYDVLEIQPVDLFPHTYHIEAVARLEARGKR